MLSKRQKLDARKVTHVREHATTVLKSPHFVMRALSGVNEARGSVVVSKKVCHGAVERTRLRRRVYAALSSVLQQRATPLWVVLFARRDAPQVDTQTLTSEIKDLYERAEEVYQ